MMTAQEIATMDVRDLFDFSFKGKNITKVICMAKGVYFTPMYGHQEQFNEAFEFVMSGGINLDTLLNMLHEHGFLYFYE